MPFPLADTAVVLPGTGSDDVLVRSAFAEALDEIGVRLVAPSPHTPSGLVDGYLAALDTASAAAHPRPILVGGISFGAHLSAAWALRNQAHCAGLLLALPAWNGKADDAPAALAAHASAGLVREVGLDRALRLATADVAPWLAVELVRSWSGHGSTLADNLDAAADYPAPELTVLSTLDVPAGIAACTDDAVHPADVAYDWADALPRAAVAETTLAAIGADRGALGRTTVQALLAALG